MGSLVARVVLTHTNGEAVFHLIQCVSHNRHARQKVNDDVGPVQETGPKRDVHEGTLS